MNQTLYLESARRFSVEQGCLMLQPQEGAPIVLHPKDINAVIIENLSCEVTLPALLLCVEQNIPVIICNERHHPTVYCLDFYSHHELYKVMLKQIAWCEARKKSLWRTVIQGKITHQLMVLNKCSKNAAVASQIQFHLSRLDSPDLSDDELNNVESISARLYFTGLFGANFKRFEDDFRNAALNYGYAIIRAMIMVELVKKGLHPTLGIWHKSSKNKFNLADDVIEIVRPLVDRTVYSLTQQASLDKESKVKLLELMTTSVWWSGSEYLLKEALSLFIDDIKRFMDQQSELLHLIQLKV